MFIISTFFLLGFILVWLLPVLKINIFFIEWVFISINYNLFFNRVLFSFVLFLVTLRVLVFRTYYLNRELNFNYYYFLLLIFVGSIFSLNYRNNIFSMLISWDILGISSFFLVLFYNNWDSCSGAINTALTNRIGDFFMFIFFSGCVFSGYCFLSFSFFCYFIIIILFMASFTKSAQFPFRSWLPKAISAPTPVSSLVHRSTLVTAGLILLFNFGFLLLNYKVLVFILLIGLFTIFFSSVAALVEEDLKKVVALRTLSQIGFSILTLGLGVSFISFLHLVRHALFKSCLFIQIGYIIHCSYGQQDGRLYRNNGGLPFFIQVQLLITLFCLCGLFFSSGIVRKDFILEFFYYSSFFYLILVLFFFISVFLTFCYSYRLWNSLFSNFLYKVIHFSNSFFITFLSLLLSASSIFFIWWLNLNLLNVTSFFLFVDFYTPLLYVFLFFLIVFFNVSLLLKVFKYKFFVDYLNKVFIYFCKDIKFIDLFLNASISKGFSVSTFFSLKRNYLLKGNVRVVFVLIILFFFI